MMELLLLLLILFWLLLLFIFLEDRTIIKKDTLYNTHTHTHTTTTMNVRVQAQDAAGLYFSHLDPYSPNDENIRNHLFNPLLAVTLSTLQGGSSGGQFFTNPTATVTPPQSASSSETGKGGVEVEEEKKSSSDWRDYLQHQQSSSSTMNDDKVMQDAYDSLPRRTKARLEAFLAGCALAVPTEINPTSSGTSTPRIKNQDGQQQQQQQQRDMVSLQDALSGFGISKIGKRDLVSRPSTPVTPKSNIINNNNNSNSTTKEKTPWEQGKSRIMQSFSSPSLNQKMMPQISEADLILRLDLYIRTLQRVKNLNEDCVIAMETPKIIKIRARLISNAFVGTAGCVRSVSTTLTKLLNCLTMEVIAMDVLSEDIIKVIRRIVLEYEHGTSFASLTFLSTPERSAESLLTPLIMKYLRYLQSNFENVIQACELERMMSRAIDSSTRKLFKNIEFQSIGHLLEICHFHQTKLHNIQLPPDVCTVAENVNLLCEDPSALRQALRDLQREVISVNGQVLPRVASRKQLLQLLSQTLNSKSLNVQHPNINNNNNKKKKKNRKESPKKVGMESSSPSPQRNQDNNANDDSKMNLSFEYDESSETDLTTTDDDPITPRPQPPIGSSPTKKYNKGKVKRKSKFHMSTVDLLTRRILIAASRTGNGGDAYFIVRDLFGGEDVEVVPTNTLPEAGRIAGPGTIDIVVRLTNVTIKVVQSFDVYPKALVGECEPLIQFHTATSETIYLRELRADESDDEDYKIDTKLPSIEGNLEESSPSRRQMVVQEKKTDKTGWRSITIRPALYEKVEVWNTLS